MSLPEVEKIGTLVAVPIQYMGSVIGCLVVEGKERQSDPESIAVLELIVAIIAPLVSNAQPSGKRQYESVDTLLGVPLTVRERLIQEMMSKGLSNKECSINLGYSESTIRQDAVSMFAKLHVTNRKQAGALFSNS